VVRFQAWRPEPPKVEPPKIEPPKVEPPKVVPPKVVKRVSPRPAEPRPTTATQTHVEPIASGITSDQSADHGTIVVNTGDGVAGPIQAGTGKDKVVAPPPAPPPKPRTVYVPATDLTQLPRAIKPVQPEVPEEWKTSGRDAVVVVEVAISASGRVIDARAVKKAGYGLDEAAVIAAKKTQFEPGLVGTTPVAVRMQIPYRFKVRG
jgi:TonB family protein